MDENFNESAPDKPFYKLGIYKYVNGDVTKCIPCSTDKKEKLIKTTKNSYGSLVKHLQYHKDSKAKYEELIKEPASNTIPRYFAIGSLSSLDRRVVHYIAASHTPFNAVNHPMFHALFASTTSSETLKDQKHYRDIVRPRVYALASAAVRRQLKECWVSFTCDVRSGPNSSFFGLTAHGITSKWDRRRYVLAVREFKGQHRGPDVRQMVEKLLREWEVPEERVHCVLHVEGSNMITAFESSEIEDADCAAHKLNLIVRRLYPNPKKGEGPTANFMKLQKQHLAKAFHDHHMKQDVVTRWDSTFAMVDRFIEQRAANDAYFVNTRRDLLLSEEEWEILNELHKLLTPFIDFSKTLCKDSSPLSVQVAIAKSVENVLRSYSGPYLKEEVKKMLVVHAEKFHGLDQYKNHAVAHAVDPRFKDSILVGQEAIDFRQNVTLWIGEHMDEEEGERIAVLDVTSPVK